MMVRNFFVIMLCLMIAPINISYACSPAVNPPEHEAALIGKAAAIVKIRIIESEAGHIDIDISHRKTITMKAEVLEAYKGKFSAGDTITIYSRNHGTCSYFLTEGVTADVLLFREGWSYYLGSTADFLTDETWGKLKHGETK